MTTIESTYATIFDGLVALREREGLSDGDIGAAVASLLRGEALEAPFDVAGEALDAAVRLWWALSIREPAVDDAGLALGVMRLDLLSAGEEPLEQIREDLMASASEQPRWVGRRNLSLVDSWVRSANAAREVAAWSGADLRLLVERPLADWRGTEARAAAWEAEASEAARRLLSRGEVREDYLEPRDVEEWTERALLMHVMEREADATADLARARQEGLPEARYHALRAMMLREDGAFGEAVAAYDEALAAGPEDAATVAFDRALTLGHAGRLREAVDGYGAAIEARPSWTAPRLNRAVSRMQLGEAEGALEDLEAAIALDPEDAELHYNVSHVYGALERQDEALAALDAAIALEPGYAAAYNNRGFLKQQMGDMDGAIADLTEALEAADHPRTRINRASAALAAERWSVAVEDVRALLSEDPTHARLHYMRGQAEEGMGRTPLAIEGYLAALRLAEGGEPFVSACEEALARLGYEGPSTWPLPTSPTDVATRDYEEALSRQARAALNEGLGRVGAALSQGDAEGALAGLEALDEAFGDHVRVQILRAAALSSMGRIEEALVVNARAVELAPELDGPRVQRAELLAGAGDLEAALEATEAAIAAFPWDDATHQIRGTLLSQLGRHEEAVEALEQARSLSPGDGDVLYNLGHVLQGAGSFEAAMEVYSQQLTLDADDVQAWLNRGTARAALGDMAGARQDYEAALGREPRFAHAHLKLALLRSLEGGLHVAAVGAIVAMMVAPEGWPLEQAARQTLAGVMEEIDERGDQARPSAQGLWETAEGLEAMNLTWEGLEAFGAMESHLAGEADYWAVRGWLGNGELSQEEVAEALERALALDPTCAPAHYLLGLIRYRGGEAVQRYEQALAHRRPWDIWEPASAHFEAGLCLMGEDEMGQAVEHLRATVEAEPDHMEAWFKLGYALDIEGEVEASIEAYSRSIALAPDMPTLWFNRACEYARLGDVESALLDLRRAVALDPGRAQEAREEDYFEALWGEPAFEAALEG